MDNTGKIFCHFVNYPVKKEGDDNSLSEIPEDWVLFGPFEFVQERHGELIDENGSIIATKVEGVWMPDANEAFSDVVISTAPKVR